MFINALKYHFKKELFCVIFIAVAILLLSKSVFAESDNIIKTGYFFPNFSLAGPFCKNDKSYLGLTEQKSYSLNSIRAEFILIEFFSIYCPVCQKHADRFNDLHRLIEKDDLISRSMKMIGIGTGNNTNEIEYYKKYFNITFPCISDPDFKIHKTFKEPRTPLLILVDKRTVPYKVLSVLNFHKNSENILQDIRDVIHNMQSRISKPKPLSLN